MTRTQCGPSDPVGHIFDRCAPEIDPIWYLAGRYALVDLWAAYLRDHHRVRPDIGIEVLARTIVEIITLRAVKMPWDPAPRPNQADGPTVAQLVRNLVTGARP
jgi:hypothetical protein